MLELIEFAPAEIQAWQLLARVQKGLGKTHQAIDSATRALELQRAAQDKTDIPASITLARLLWDQGDSEAARAMLGILMLRRPDDEELAGLKQQWEMEMPA